MLFHWLRDYGKGRSGATDVVNQIFAMAKESSPEVFEGDSTIEPQRQAKFEFMCPWAAVALLDKDDATARKVMEELVDRLEIGLREGGVGDMKVGVHVRKYAAALHGRIRRYASLIDVQDWDTLGDALKEHGVNGGIVTSIRSRIEAGGAEKSKPKPKKA